MLNIKCNILDSNIAGGSFAAVTSAHGILYSSRREAMLIPCTDMSVLLKRMSDSHYNKLLAPGGSIVISGDAGLVDLTHLGAFLRVSSMPEVDTVITKNYDTFASTAYGWDTGLSPERGGVRKMNVTDII